MNIEKKKKLIGFAKYSYFKDILKQEKFLSLNGNLEEAINMQKLFLKSFQKENELLNKRKRDFENITMKK